MYIKLTAKNHKHRGLVYKEGLNIDFRPFDTTEECSAGGIYICEEKDLAHWTTYAPVVWVWDAQIPEGTQVHFESNRKVKVNQVILSNCRKIEELADQLWDTEEKQMEAIQIDLENLKFIRNPSEQLQLVAVKRNGNAIQFIVPLGPSEQVQLAAVQDNGYTIQYIIPFLKPSEQVQLAAVRQNGYAIRYIAPLGPSEQVQLAAVQENAFAIHYIKNPSQRVRLAAAC